MTTEIELKARVKDPEALKEVIASLAVFDGSFEKEDAYWYSSESYNPDVRIRKETDMDPQGKRTTTIWVTYKVKDRRNGIEVNDEREFSVSDAENFEGLLKRLGLAQGMKKHKQGWAWDYQGITIELVEIGMLGWFVELEILADNHRAETLRLSRSRLLELLRCLGLEEDAIERRYYAEMLGSALETIEPK